MLCPFKRVTRRPPAEWSVERSFGNCSESNCMAYRVRAEYDTKPPYAEIGKRPSCLLIEHLYAAPIAYCSMLGSADVGTKE